jgi:exodeoxyribonuclease VII small subunit
MPEITFEEALKKLEEVVKRLEEGDLPLEESLSLFEEGIRLSRVCAQKLDEVEKRIEILVKDGKGNTRIEPFSTEEEKENP